MLLNIRQVQTTLKPMKTTLTSLLAAATFALASPAAAECFADYKAKRDNPLKLHYGVAEISGACTTENATDQLSRRLKTDGWVLLNVLSVFDSSGLQERQSDAGQYYLRY